MTEDDHIKACDALIDWFRSQGISPDEAVMTMAKTIAVACISLAAEAQGDGMTEKKAARIAIDGMKAASQQVLREGIRMFEAIGDKSKQ
jgi:hypothetical protein